MTAYALEELECDECKTPQITRVGVLPKGWTTAPYLAFGFAHKPVHYCPMCTQENSKDTVLPKNGR